MYFLRSFRFCSEVTELSRDPPGVVPLDELGPGVERDEPGSPDGMEALLVLAATFG